MSENMIDTLRTVIAAREDELLTLKRTLEILEGDTTVRSLKKLHPSVPPKKLWASAPTQKQILAYLATSPGRLADIYGANQQLSVTAIHNVCRTLVKRGWIGGNAGGYWITETGLALIEAEKQATTNEAIV